MIEVLIALLIGLSSGFIGALAGGGGMISIPALMFMGLSPASAIATTRLSAFSNSAAQVIRFNKSNLIKWREIAPLFILAIIGGIAGSEALLNIDENILSKVIGILLLVLLPVLLINKDFGTVARHRSKNYRYIGYFAIFLLMIYTAMFGGGGGIFMVYTIVYFFGMTIIQAKANGTALELVATTVAIVYYLGAGSIDLFIGIPLMIGAAVGGWLGAHTAIKKGNAFVKALFFIIIIVSSVKLLFFS